MPYVTNAKSSAIEIGQASQVMTSLLAADDWLSDSFLNEAGVKFTFLDNHLVGCAGLVPAGAHPAAAKRWAASPA